MRPRYKDNAALLADARRSLLGSLSVAVWSCLLFTVIQLFLSRLSASFSFQSAALTFVVVLAAQVVTAVFASLFSVGLACVFLNLQYGQPAGIRNLFVCFGSNQDTSIRVCGVVKIGELVALFPLQIFLFLIPEGSVISYAPLIILISVLCLCGVVAWRLTFAMAYYVLLDFPELGWDRILRTAKSMMRGNRMRYFLLMVRFLPLYLLGIFSLGLTSLWTGSYQRAASAAFYKDLISAAK